MAEKDGLPPNSSRRSRNQLAVNYLKPAYNAVTGYWSLLTTETANGSTLPRGKPMSFDAVIGWLSNISATPTGKPIAGRSRFSVSGSTQFRDANKDTKGETEAS